MTSRYQFLSSPGVGDRCTLAMFHLNMTPGFARIHVPVLMIVGGRDTTTPPEASKTMADSITAAQLQVLPIGKHYALLESHEAVNSAIASFATRSCTD